MDLRRLQIEIIKTIPQAYDEIPEDFNFKDDIAIEVKTGNSIIDSGYRQEIDLQIRIVGTKNREYEIKQRALEIDKLINKKDFLNYYIVRESVWITGYTDSDKYNNVLQYNIFSY